MKETSLVCLLVLLITLTIVCISDSGSGQISKEVNGIIDADSKWTKNNSPYTLTGPVLIKQGVTLTIEPGVTIDLGNYYIQVNGTLNARGTIADNICFNGGSGMPGAIAFTRYSPSWSEQKNEGSIIENSIITVSSIAISIGDTSPKINNNTITGAIWTADGDSSGQPLTASSPIITNNVLLQSGYGLVLQISTSPVIVNNTIKGSIRTGTGSTIISGNYIEGSIESNGNKDHIVDNVLTGPGNGYGVRTGFAVVERNLITNYDDAILFWIAAFPTIRNNTISNNVNGISVLGYDRGSYSPQIYLNNVHNNSGFNINLQTYERHPTGDINATNNWWGTTNTQTITQAIHDSNDDFNVGTVIFEPILTQPNPQALPNAQPLSTIPEITPMPSNPETPVPSENPTLTPNGLFRLTWEQVALVVLGILVVVLAIALVLSRKKR